MPGEDVGVSATGRVIPFPGFLRAYVEGSDDPNAELEDRLTRAEIVTWPSFDGVEIEGLLYRPAGVEGPVPLFVEVHGGPAWQWEDALRLDWHDWAQMLASRGWAVLMPNPRGSTGYGSAFEKLLQDNVGFGESKDLVAGAQAMVARGIADPARLAIGGWSWGGYLTARVLHSFGAMWAGEDGLEITIDSPQATEAVESSSEGSSRASSVTCPSLCSAAR